VAIRRGFATREEALAFDRRFVVRVGGVEAGRSEARFSRCDLVSAVGLDPAARRRAVFEYEVGSAPTLQAYPWRRHRPEVSCWLEVLASAPDYYSPIPLPMSDHELEIWLLVPAGTVELALDGVPTEPLVVGALPDGRSVFGVTHGWPDAEAIAGLQTTLSLALDGTAQGEVTLSFERCIARSMTRGKPPEDLVRQENELTTATGVLAIDWGEFSCWYRDGTGFSVDSG
jgi:hypothetical protein